MTSSESIGILVFTNLGVLQHKIKDGKQSEGKYCYWTLTKFPKRFDDINYGEYELRLYMAVEGKVRGYFIIHNTEEDEIQFYSESWHPIQDGEVLKPSQGWRYYDI